MVAAVCAFLACSGWMLGSGMLGLDGKLLPWSLDSALFALSLLYTLLLNKAKRSIGARRA